MAILMDEDVDSNDLVTLESHPGALCVAGTIMRQSALRCAKT